MYTLTFFESVERDLSKIPGKDIAKIWEKLIKLKETPRPPGTIKLAGRKSDYRVRYGKYRIIYQVFDEEKKVRVVQIGPRKDIYK
jgi:mRNA interferase RelE/StbE